MEANSTRILNNRIRGYVDAIKKHNFPLVESLLIESSLTIEYSRNKIKPLLALIIRPTQTTCFGGLLFLLNFTLIN